MSLSPEDCPVCGNALLVFEDAKRGTHPECAVPKTHIVVSLTRSYWHDNDGAYQRISLRYLKRQTKGFNVFDDDCSIVGASEVFPKITNLDECRDGKYVLSITKEYRDWETGLVEEWDYKLTPLTP